MASNRSRQEKAIPTAADLPARVAELGPLIDSLAEEAESIRQLPAPLLDALLDAGLYRLLLPAQYGGAQIDPLTFFRTLEAVAAHDASTAWCLCQANGCAMAAAYMEPAAAQQIWGQDARAIVAWGPGKSAATPVEGGYRLTCKCSFASGAHHASWLGSHAQVLGPDGEPERRGDGSFVIRTMLFPAGEAAMHDVWDVIGLRATGSDDFEVADLFVPDAYSLTREDPQQRRPHGPLYLFPAMNLYAIGFSATALGIARTMLQAFKDLALEKKPWLRKQRLKDEGVVQAEVARAQVRLDAARSFVERELDDIWRIVAAAGELTIPQRMRIRLATTHAIHEAKDVADAVYDAAGATAVFAGSAFERRFRDIHTVTQQVQGRKAHYQTVGAFLLGHPPDLSVV